MAIAGINSVDYALTRVFGRTAHAHALLRRLSTQRGGLIASPTYGYDLRNSIGATTPTHIVSQRVREQCLLDERTDDVLVTVTDAGETRAVKIDVKSSEGPFTLTITSNEQLTYQLFVDGNPGFWGVLS